MELNDYRKLRYDDFFLAIIKREMNWDEAEHVYLTHPDFPDKITAIDLLKIAVNEALIENDEPLTDENRKKIEDDVKKKIAPHLEEWYPVILVKVNGEYIDLSQMKKLDSSYKIICQVPFSNYHMECDYSFEEDEDGPYLNIDMEPFELFVKNYENGKIV